ncbi:MAG TPA: LolA-related protein [Rhodanobacter sp.]|nr:LolA-related protein [Rhodanobacter sp.]
MLLSLMVPLSAVASGPEVTPATATSVTQALIASLGQPAPARTAFAEARFMHLLDRPLVVSGELAWFGGNQLQRRVEHPHAETATIADGEVTVQRAGRQAHSFSLTRAPQLQVLLDSFVALLSGDAARLDQAFEIQRSGDAAQWTLVLVPRDAGVAGSVASIEIDGRGKQSRCMRMQEADGDLAVDLLGPLAARMPARPTREALLALCQGGS